MEILGWIVWLLFSLGLTIFGPYIVIGVSALGGGLSKGERVFALLIFFLGAFSLYSCITSAPFEITLK